MRIGELARAAETTVRALRYYEEHGLLHARRSPNGYRDYDESAVLRVRNIRRLLAAGFTADEARAFSSCLDQPGAGDRVCLESVPAITRKLAALDEEITALVRTRDRLAVQLRRARGESAGSGDDTTDLDGRYLNRGVRRDHVQEIAGDIAAR
ncbi:MerR family transcriptional regulator [Actinoallomurus sp. CA-150999]|uniref:MerR family transcriptional regulator n=1 Tax=Actinoallomurus sp. CA-150999 TaxID=3239887 RepID=UPI003D8B60FF